MLSPVQATIAEDEEVEKLRAIASLTEHPGWEYATRELDNKVQSALRAVHDAQEREDAILVACTRKWLSLRESVYIIKSFPKEVRKQLEERGDRIYGFR